MERKQKKKANAKCEPKKKNARKLGRERGGAVPSSHAFYFYVRSLIFPFPHYLRSESLGQARWQITR